MTPFDNDADIPTANHRLIQAIRSQNLNGIEAALAEGGNPNIYEQGKYLLDWAVERQVRVKVRSALIEAGARGQLSGLSPYITLVEVLTYGSLTTAQIVIEEGVDINQVGWTTPLAIAAEKGYGKLVQQLIELGADVDDASPLNRAIAHNHTPIALTLLEAGADPNYIPDVGDPPPIAIAIKHRNSTILKALLDAGANPTIPIFHIYLDPANNIAARDTVPIILAALWGDAKALALLIESGGDPLQKDTAGLAAYDWAEHNGHLSVLEVLRDIGITGPVLSPDEQLLQGVETRNLAQVQEAIALGANVNCRDRRSLTRHKTPLMFAAYRGEVAIVDYLLEHGADVSLNDATEPIPEEWLKYADPEDLEDLGCQLGSTALLLAAKKGHLPVVERLILAGANVNGVDGLGYTPLAMACRSGYQDIVQRLVAHGADINTPEPYGYTPLMVAISECWDAIAYLLLDLGADPHIVSCQQETALMIAARRANLHLVKRLLEYRVDVNVRSPDWGTALTCAIQSGYYLFRNRGQEIACGLTESANPVDEYHKDHYGAWSRKGFPDDKRLPSVAVLLEAGADPNLSADRSMIFDVVPFLSTKNPKFKHKVLSTFIQQYTKHYCIPEIVETINPPISESDSATRTGPPLVVPVPEFGDRAQSQTFRQALAELETLCHNSAFPLQDIEGGFYVTIRAKYRESFELEATQAQFLEKGCFVFAPTYRAPRLNRLHVLPTVDKFEALMPYLSSIDERWGVFQNDILAQLRQLNREQPFIITHIQPNGAIAGRFLSPSSDPMALSRRLTILSAPTVKHNFSNDDYLIKNLQKTGEFSIHWEWIPF